MTEFTALLFEVRDQVATITLNRPERRNAWTVTMARELDEAMLACDRDDAIRVVIVTGAGRSFSVGADLSVGTIAQPGEPEASPEPPDELPFVSPSTIRKPVIAAINGDGVGAGITYPMHCDIRIVAEDAKLGFPFVRRGVIPEMGGHWTVPRAVGVGVATELILTGRIFSGREAVQLGLCHRALPAGEVLTEARRVASDIVVNVAPVSAAIAKRLLWSSTTMTLDQMLAREKELFLWCAERPDAVEGVASFLEKRPPRWQMRPSVDVPPWGDDPAQ
jgi:enoyl-CoA hydratase/carnithine racemase